MRLRPYIPSHDFDSIKNWVTDERTNALWSANHAPLSFEHLPVLQGVIAPTQLRANG